MNRCTADNVPASFYGPVKRLFSFETEAKAVNSSRLSFAKVLGYSATMLLAGCDYFDPYAAADLPRPPGYVDGIPRFVAVGLSHVVAYSTDGGASWAATNAGTGRNLWGIACDPDGRFVAVGKPIRWPTPLTAGKGGPSRPPAPGKYSEA
jgi:hypothetical protein